MGQSSFVKALRFPWRLLRPIIFKLSHLAVHIATMPYYRIYHVNTIDPLQKIAILFTQDPHSRRLLRAIALWRFRKLAELQFTSIACAILAAAVIGAFSWTTIEEAFWLTHGFWHSSLVLSILGILLSASQVTVLNTVGPIPPPNKFAQCRDAVQRYEPLLLSRDSERWKPRKKMVFTWQAPIMFMSYSVCAFLAGLTILVCTPLIRREGEWTDGCNVAVMYLVTCAIAGAGFVFCSFWVYHYVDLNFDAKEDGEETMPEEGSRNIELLPYRGDLAITSPGVSGTGSFLNRFERRGSS